MEQSDSEIDDDTLAHVDNGMEEEFSSGIRGNTKEGYLQYQRYK